MSQETRASQLAQDLDVEPARLTETYSGEGTTNQPIIDYIKPGEKINNIFTAKLKGIAINDKDSPDVEVSRLDDWKPTYVFTDKRVLGIMPMINVNDSEYDREHEILYSSITDVQTHFGWTKSRMEIEANGHNYHLWFSSTDKEDIDDTREYIIRNAEIRRDLQEIRSDLPITIDKPISLSKLDKADNILDDIESSFNIIKQKTSDYNIDEIDELEESIDKEKKRIQDQKEKKARQDIQEIQSDLSNIEKVISDSNLNEADTKLSNIESRLETVEQKASDYDIDGINELKKSINRQKQKIQEKKEKEKKQIRQDIQEIRSNLSNIEKIISDSNLDEASTKLSNIESNFNIVEKKASNYDITEVSNLQTSISKKKKKLQLKRGNYEFSGVDFRREITSLQSDLSQIDAFIGRRELKSAKDEIKTTKQRTELLAQNQCNKQQLDQISELKKSINKKRERIRSIEGKEKQPTEENHERTEPEKEIQEELNTVRFDLDEIDTLVIKPAFQQANKKVDEVNSNISSLKKRASQKNLDKIKIQLEELEQKCNEQLSKSHILSQVREMDPYEFEKFVAKIWEKQGWDAKATSGSADRGVDVIAEKVDAFEKRRHLIQVKRHGENSRVGSEDIQRYASLYQRDEQVDKVFVVTSNRFTSEAEEVAKRRDVSTVNGDELHDMLTET